MRLRIRGLALVIGVAVTALGCAASGPARPTAAFNAPWLPPEVPAGFFAWPVIGFRPLVLRTDDGEALVILTKPSPSCQWRLHRQSGGRV